MLLTLVFVLVGLFGAWYSLGGISVSLMDDRGIYIVLGILTLIFAILAFIGALGLAYNFGNPSTMHKVGGGFGFLTFLFAIITPIYFWLDFSANPIISAIGLDFWNPVGGPGYAWYLMIIAAIIALISISMLRKIKPAAQ